MKIVVIVIGKKYTTRLWGALAIVYGWKGTHATVCESEGYQWVSTGLDDQCM